MLMPKADEEWEEWKAQREAEKVQAIERLARTVFGVGGSCGCDGYYDDGCPLCTPAKMESFQAEITASIERHR